MPRPPRLLEALLCLAAAGGALVSAGCPSPEERTCDIMCDCTGCSEASYLDCVDKTETAKAAAVEASCLGVFDAYLTCVEDELECRDDAFSFDGCEDQETSLRRCGLSATRTVCELANDHFLECGQGAPFGICPEAVACSAECSLSVSCDGLNGIDFDEAERLNQCNNLCFMNPQ